METEKKLQVKKEWTKPQLLVLVRSKSEEAVLTTCKQIAIAGSVGTFNIQCEQTESNCNGCLTIAVS